MNRPPSGTMVYWRGKGRLEWRFGYCTHTNTDDLVRMGHWNGDTTNGPIVSSADIEWKEYRQ